MNFEKILKKLIDRFPQLPPISSCTKFIIKVYIYIIEERFIIDKKDKK